MNAEVVEGTHEAKFERGCEEHEEQCEQTLNQTQKLKIKKKE